MIKYYVVILAMAASLWSAVAVQAGPFGILPPPPAQGSTAEKSGETTVTTDQGSATMTRSSTRTGTATQIASPWLGSEWNTNYGGLVFYLQPKGKVCGTYKYEAGRLTNCTITDKTVSGTWVEAGAQTGRFSFTLTSGGKKFTGWWSYAGDTAKAEWKGTRIK